MSIPAYSVKVSLKAKHARLKMSATGGLVVIVPKGFDESRIPQILEKKRGWFRKVEDRFEVQRKFLVPEPQGRLPERILLRVIGEEWSVDYRATDAEVVSTVERLGNRLLVFGDTDNERACKNSLRRWLSRQTREHISPWLLRLATERNIVVERILVKSQRTRWGSCSARKTVSLNLRLMFLPENLVRYVLLHELTHTLHLNHSRKFWAELSSFEPKYQHFDSELRSAWRFIPAWLGPSPFGERPEL